MCHCASFRHVSTITCPEYDTPTDIDCSEYNAMCLGYDDMVHYPEGTDPFELYKQLKGITETGVLSSQTSVLSDISNT